ncbi:MAG: hypothetical protein ACR2MY_12980 [Candidatus Dormibacteria bacterium]
MIMMKPRKSNQNSTIATQVRELSNSCSFLDVLRDTCNLDGGRYTLSAESGGVAYTVLVDRGGPFNAIGGGAAGSRALISASQLRSGRCTITRGWPVEQPLYQPGLDLTLKGLVDGVVDTPHLPPHRGVDSLRNAEWRDAYVTQPAPAQAPVVPPKTEPRMVWKPVGSASAWLPENDLPAALPAAERPAVGKVHAEGPGAAKQLATQALLWLVECDDPSQYSFEQAAAMARHSLADGVSQVVHPFRRDLNTRLSRIKNDWEKSGEVAAKATHKNRVKAAAVEPDHEFRLR